MCKDNLRNEFPKQPESAIDFMYKQMQEAKNNVGSVITCACGLKQPMRFMFRCFYCGIFYCHKCATKHFGMSRKEYYSTTRETKEIG